MSVLFGMFEGTRKELGLFALRNFMQRRKMSAEEADFERKRLNERLAKAKEKALVSSSPSRGMV